MNTTAFLAGYLHKEAYITGAPTEAHSYHKTPAASGPGVVDRVSKWMGDKASGAVSSLAQPVIDDAMGKMEGKIKSTLGDVESKFKSYGENVEKKMAEGMKAHAAATAGATIGTGLLSNMAAGSRHKEMLKAIKGIGRQPINKPAAQRAFRLNRPVPGTAGRAR